MYGSGSLTQSVLTMKTVRTLELPSPKGWMPRQSQYSSEGLGDCSELWVFSCVGNPRKLGSRGSAGQKQQQQQQQQHCCSFYRNTSGLATLLPQVFSHLSAAKRCCSLCVLRNACTDSPRVLVPGDSRSDQADSQEQPQGNIQSTKSGKINVSCPTNGSMG